MITLNLTATGNDQKRIKEYLQENASEMLADKINNGVKITKDGKTLLNKKDLNSFVQFACEEAKKQAEKGARSAMVADEIVYGWAMHYFEEDSILGNLYNENGTKYKPMPKSTPKISKPTFVLASKPQNKQQSLFELLEQSTISNDDIEEKNEDIEGAEIEKNENIQEKVEKPTPVEGTFIVSDKLIEMREKAICLKQEKILTEEEIENSFDKHTMYILSSILDGQLEIQ